MNGKKFDHGKPDYSLIVPEVLEGLAKVLTFGAAKYDRENWKHVDDAENRYYSALMRHIEARRKGDRLDPETGLPHSFHCIANAMFIAYFDTLEDYENPSMDEMFDEYEEAGARG